MFFSRILILLALVCIAWFAVCPSAFAYSCMTVFYHDGDDIYDFFECPALNESLDLICSIGGKNAYSPPALPFSIDCELRPPLPSQPIASIPFWEREIDCQLKNSIVGLLLAVNSFLSLTFGIRIILGIVRRLLSSI